MICVAYIAYSCLFKYMSIQINGMFQINTYSLTLSHSLALKDGLMSKILFKNHRSTNKPGDIKYEDVGNIERIVLSSSNDRRIK